MQQSLHDRISKRILDLDERLQVASDESQNETRATIDALAECTRLPKDGIALLVWEMTLKPDDRAPMEGRACATRAWVVGVAAALALGVAGFTAGLYSATRDPSWVDAIQPSEAFMSPKQNAYVYYAYTASVLSTLTRLRYSMAEYYTLEGRFPENLAELGLDAAAMSDGDKIRAVHIDSQGRIVADLSAKAGENKHLILAPGITMDGTHISWKCETDLAISGALPAHAMACEENQSLDI